MNDVPDFSDVVQADEKTTTSSSSNAGGTTGQAFIKGKYGTTLYHASDGCDDCHRNADAAVKVEGVDRGGRGAEHDVILACNEHLGDHTEGLVRSGMDFELLGF